MERKLIRNKKKRSKDAQELRKCELYTDLKKLRDRETERETDRRTDRQTGRQRQREREKVREKEIKRKTGREIEIQKES